MADEDDWLWSASRGWFQAQPAAAAWQQHEQHEDWQGSWQHWNWETDQTSWQGWGSPWQENDWHGGQWNDRENRWWQSWDSSHTTTWGDPWSEGRWSSTQTVLPETNVRSEASQRGDNEESDMPGPTNSQTEHALMSGSSTANRQPKTGKEIIPQFDGTTPVRDYKRRVELFLASTGIDPEFRAGRLVEQMTGVAWKTTETLDMAKLRTPDGVDYLLQHLQTELEPVEHMRVFGTLHNFFKTFRRARGEEFVSYDMAFRSQMQKLDEVGAGLQGIVKSWWYLECAGLGSELRKQVITTSGGSYQYEKLREALMALVPQVRQESGEQPHHPTSNQGANKSKFFHQKTTKIKQVNMVQEGQDNEEEADENPEDDIGELGEEDPDELERQAQVLMTQASRRRAQVEQARGYMKSETKDQRDRRISDMKSRMPCSACKANGKTSYGHWHSDKECPFYNPAGKSEQSKGVFVVQQADQFSDTSDDAFCVHVSTTWNTLTDDSDLDMQLLALSDTCCAKTVAGQKWMSGFMKHLYKNNCHFWIVDEAQGFRFGPGPKIGSEYAVVAPICVGKRGCQVHLKISVVPTDVPLLVSRQALQELGAIVNLPDHVIEFVHTGCRMPLRTTSSGHIGFYIWADDHPHRGDPDLWEQLDGSEGEVLISKPIRTEGSHKTSVPLEPPKSTEFNEDQFSSSTAHATFASACSSLDRVTGASDQPLHEPRESVEGDEKIHGSLHLSEVEGRLRELKEIWRLVKPVKEPNLLPPSWKKHDLETLKSYYVENCLEYYGRISDGHWARWTRGNLITELELWMEDRKEDMKLHGEMENPNMGPRCEACDIPMIIRTNKLSKEDFWACIRFPACRQTLPMQSAGLSTKECLTKDKTNHRKNVRPEEQAEPKRRIRRGQPAPEPWDICEEPEEPSRQINANLTSEEMSMIQELRKQKEVQAAQTVPQGYPMEKKD
eukprot:s3290_g3.t1